MSALSKMEKVTQMLCRLLLELQVRYNIQQNS